MLKKGKVGNKYIKIVWAFIALSFIVIIFIGYFAFAKTTITIIPSEIDTTADFQVTLNDLEGEMLQKEVSDTLTFTDFSDTSKESEGQAYGIVTIYNETAGNQGLVATTRLMSDQGVLFRTQEDITVPAKGSIKANVKADETGSKGDIGPGKFEIVNLDTAKKKLIYGESDQAMAGGIRKIATVTEEDISAASQKLSKDLILKATEELKAEAQNPDNLSENKAEKTILESEISAEVGDEVDELEVYEKVRVSFLTFDDNKLLAQAKVKLEEELDMGSTLVSEPTLDDIEYQVLSIDEETNDAVIKVTVHGKKIINDQNSILEKGKISNKTKKSISKHYNNFEEIDSVKVDFSPFWVQTAPILEDNINIVVK
ncbi:MAG: hypothetical protein ABH835_01250 [Patescibacteria group bacterium]|nr:hypothetical protein [Patescibacteria group bacterium]